MQYLRNVQNNFKSAASNSSYSPAPLTILVASVVHSELIQDNKAVVTCNLRVWLLLRRSERNNGAFEAGSMVPVREVRDTHNSRE